MFKKAAVFQQPVNPRLALRKRIRSKIRSKIRRAIDA